VTRPAKRRRRLGRDFDPAAHDPTDPDPWLALYLDTGLPFDDTAKAALLKGADSYSRGYLLPFMKPFIFVFFLLVHAFRRIFVHWPSAPKTLHWLIWWGLKHFATPEANYLILRHFNLGTEILAFIRDNAPDGVEMNSHPLRPKTLAELKDNIFLQHDLNIYNFIIELNTELRAKGLELTPRARVDFSSISDAPWEFEEFQSRPWNFIDIETAIELYTPLYALFLPKHDFIRAANSLQLDETIAIYLARVTGLDYHLAFVTNGDPMVPLSTFQSGHRLMLHGLDAEALYGWLQYLKRQQAKADAAQIGRASCRERG